MAKLVLNAYIPSASEYDKAWSKFRAFMGAKLSEKAKNDGALENSKFKAGFFFLRTRVTSLNGVLFGMGGGKRSWRYCNDDGAGLRVAFNIIYNQESELVKGCKDEKRTALVFKNDNGGPEYDGEISKEEVTSTAPIITLANGTKCIWLNKEECESGEAKTMELWTLDLVEKTGPFASRLELNDWAESNIYGQCENWLKNNLSDEEKKMVVPVEMSSKGRYQKATPILEEEKGDSLIDTYTDLKSTLIAYKKTQIDSQTLIQILDTIPISEIEKF